MSAECVCLNKVGATGEHGRYCPAGEVMAAALYQERALADDLADKLDRTLIALRARQGFPNLVADGNESLARYREAREL